MMCTGWLLPNWHDAENVGVGLLSQMRMFWLVAKMVPIWYFTCDGAIDQRLMPTCPTPLGVCCVAALT